MPALSDAYPEFREALTVRFGRAGATQPAPSVGDFGAILAAFLRRHLADRVVAPTLEALRDAGLLEPEPLASADPAEILDALGVAKAPKWLATARRLAAWVVERGGPEALADASTETLRDDLRALRGLGPTVADALLRDGLDRPAFPIDRPAFRVLVRHGWIDPDADYDEARATVERLAPADPAALRDLADWLDALAAGWCKVAAPRCEGCPLRPWLPESGPLDPQP